MGTATNIAIKAIKEVPAIKGIKPNASFNSSYSAAVIADASRTNALWGLQLVPNRKSKIFITEKNFILSNNNENIIPIVVNIAISDETNNKPFKINNFKNTTKVFFFLGSSIGNFHPGEDIKFLKNLAKCVDKNSFVFIGVDLVKNPNILEKAYNDKAGYTAKFSLNLINIINNKFKSRLNINNFSYLGIYNKKLRSIFSYSKHFKNVNLIFRRVFK